MEHVIDFLRMHHEWKYLLIFLIGIPEGPILTVVCGFLSTQGFLNPWLVYPAVVAGDVVGDAAHYLIGRIGSRFFKWVGRKIGVTSEKIEATKQRMEHHPLKYVMKSKLIHGPGVLGIVAAGALRIPYSKFFLYCLAVTLCQSAAFLIIGLTIGGSYELIHRILNFYAAAMFVLVAAAAFFYFLFKKGKKK